VLLIFCVYLEVCESDFRIRSPILYQYNETNVMHFSFNLFRIKDRGCVTIAVQSWLSQLTLNASNIPSTVCIAPPEDEKVMLETRRGPWFSINWMKSASRWFHYTDMLWCTVRKSLSPILCVQTGGSRDRFPMVLLEYFIDIILPTTVWSWDRLSI
jgi:hypothetical protein